MYENNYMNTNAPQMPTTNQNNLLYDQLFNSLRQNYNNGISSFNNTRAQMNTNIIRVSGIEEARKYPMENCIMLDTEKPIMYFKYLVMEGTPPYYTNVVSYRIIPDADIQSDEVNSVEETKEQPDYGKIIDEIKELKEAVGGLGALKTAISEVTEMKDMLKSII